MNRVLLGVLGAICLAGAIPARGNDSVLERFKEVSGKYFREKMILLLVWNGEEGTEPEWMRGIIEYVIRSVKWSVNLSNENYVPRDLDYLHLKLDLQRAKNIIVLLGKGTSNAKGKLARLTENGFWLSRARILVVVETENAGEEILGFLWSAKRALNSVVMTVGGGRVRFVTSDPFRKVTRSRRRPVGLYRDKIPADFRGHVLRMGLFYSEPYVLRPKAPGEYVDGIELRIVNALKDHLNFTVEFVESPKGENPYISSRNGKPSGLFGLLHRGVADMIFLGLKSRYDRHILSDALTPHTYDRSVWIVPTSEHGKDGFYEVFQAEVWIAIGVTFLFLNGVFIVLTRCGDRRPPPVTDCLLEMLVNQLNYPPYLTFERTRMRVFQVLMYVYALHIISAYNSGLVKSLSDSAGHAFLETPQEATDAGYVAYLYPSGMASYNVSHFDMWRKIFKPSGHVFSQDYPKTLTVISVNKTAFTLMLENVAKYEISKRADRRKQMVHIMEYGSQMYPISFFMSRGHPLTELFERNVQHLVESGIVHLWLRRFLTRYRKFKKREGNFKRDEEPLALEHFLVILYVVSALWLASVVLFILELTCGKRCRRKTEKRKLNATK